MLKRAPPTEQQLRQVFDRERAFHPGWPATFEQAQADPLVSRLLGMMARQVDFATQGPRRFDPELQLSEPALPVRRAPYRTASSRRRTLDFKSLRAGEKPDLD